jgi:hypothetical protein
MTTTTQTLSKISQLLLVNVLYLFTILFFTTTNQTKPKKRPQFQIPKMHAKDGSHTTHTHSQVFFFGTIVFGPFLFLFLLTKKIGKIVKLFYFIFPLQI